MAPVKKKISRKELLKKPDEFITTSNKVYAWATQHFQKVLIAVIALVVAAAAVMGYQGYRSHREGQAHEKYFAALELAEAPQKIKSLQALTTDFSGTKAADKAWVSLGHLFYEQKDFPKAIQAYQTALNRKTFPTAFQSLIKEDLAYTLEEKGDLKGAAAYFSQLLQDSDPFLKESAHLNLARVHLKMGQAQEAKTTFQNFLKAYPNSNYAPLVRDRLARL